MIKNIEETQAVAIQTNTQIRWCIFFTWGVSLWYAMYVASIKHGTWNIFSSRVMHVSMLFNDEYRYYGKQLGLLAGLAMLRVCYLYGDPVLSFLQVVWCLSYFMLHVWYHTAHQNKHYIPAVGIFAIPYVMFIRHLILRVAPAITTTKQIVAWTIFIVVDLVARVILLFNTVSGNWLALRNAEYFCFAMSCVMFGMIYEVPVHDR